MEKYHKIIQTNKSKNIIKTIKNKLLKAIAKEI